MPDVGPVLRRGNSVPFQTLTQIEFNPSGNENSVSSTPPELQAGVPSIFNPYSVVVFPSLGGDYNSLIDDAAGNPNGNFSPSSKKLPTISNLVNDAELAKKEPYNYTDFLYCKYVGKIPNNQLITLRRYPAPTFDNLAVPSSVSDLNQPINNSRQVEEQEEFFPIAQAVTWFGEETENKLSDLLSFTVNFNWKKVEAEVNTVSGNEQGSEDSPAPGAAKLLGILTGQVNTPFATANAQYDPYNNGPYSHRVYGPVNVISSVYKRDRGLDYKNTMTINFHYSLKSIGNINPKAAMLDLMANLLALTYNNAAFWGGANRYFPNKPTYPFLGGKDGMNAWYRGEPATFAKAVGAQISSSKNAISDILGKLASDPISTLKNIAAGAAKLGMIELEKGRAPSIVAIKALLTGEPIGEWHMVVGNPYNPIAKIGNLICTESKFKFNDTIGADDFPTELSVAITVEHGRPRDKGDIESIFNRGQGRIYYPPSGSLDVLNQTSATRNSTNDTSWKTGNNTGPGGDYTKTVGLFTGTQAEYNQLLGSINTSATNVTTTGKLALQTAYLMLDKPAGSQKKNTDSSGQISTPKQ